MKASIVYTITILFCLLALASCSCRKDKDQTEQEKHEEEAGAVREAAPDPAAESSSHSMKDIEVPVSSSNSSRQQAPAGYINNKDNSRVDTKPAETESAAQPVSTAVQIPDILGVWAGELDSVIVLREGSAGLFYPARSYVAAGGDPVIPLQYELKDGRVYISGVFDYRIVSIADSQTMHFLPEIGNASWIGEIFHHRYDLTEDDVRYERLGNTAQ